MRPQRVLWRQRLGLGHVQKGVPKLFVVQRHQQGVLVHHAATRHVDQGSARLHGCELLGAHELVGFWRGGHGQNYPVKFRQATLPLLGAECGGAVLLRVAPHGGNVHVEAFEALRHFLPDGAKTHNQGLAFIQLGPARCIGQPFMAVLRLHQGPVTLGNAQHGHEHVFGNGDGVDACAIGQQRTACF